MPYRQLSGAEISRGPVTLLGKSARSAKARLRVLLGPRRRTFLTHERTLSSAGEGEARREREREAANCARATLKDLTEKIGSDLSKRWRDGRVKLDRARVPRVYATDRRAGPHL